MLKLDIPTHGLFHLEYLLLDLNGTIALDGELLPGFSAHLGRLKNILEPWLISADTQRTLAVIADSLSIRSKRLDSGEEARQKADLVKELGAHKVVAIGNGANDVEMLRQAALGIAVIGGEGLAAKCLGAADIVVLNIEAALDLLIYPRRLLATLRA
jgi:P-type E1-E2 ATPase